MGQIGSFLLLFGIASIILNFFNYEFMLLSWVDNWGTTVGWAIRITMIVVGAALLFFGQAEKEEGGPAT